MTAVQIHGVQLADLPRAWPMVHPWIESACDQNGWNASHVLSDLRAEQQQLWVICVNGLPSACVTSRIDIERDGTRVLFIPTLAGAGMGAWLGQVVDLMRQFARAHECTELRCSGRRGWVRALDQYGARESSVTVSLEV